MCFRRRGGENHGFNRPADVHRFTVVAALVIAMLPLDTISSGRAAFLGGIWAALGVWWAFACMWVERDARLSVGRSRRWKSLLVSVGGLMLLTTLLGGAAAIPLIAIVLPLAVIAYIVARDAAVPHDKRLIRPDVILDVLAPVARRIGLMPLWDRMRSSLPTPAEPAPDEAAVILLKKDGTSYGGVHGAVDRDVAEAVHVAQRIIGKAVTLRATDVHFEPKSGKECQVRFRIDGIMQTRQVVTAELGRAVVSALKVLGDMDIAERRRPQDGTFVVRVADRRFDVRAASGPTNFGEKMSLRLLDADGGIVKAGLGGLGMRDSMARSIREVIQRSHGMLIVTGPTGSGKTTTLYACLNDIDLLSRNVITIEDPVEYRLDNVSQTAVNNPAGLTFAKILRSVLRQDPDVILVGEIRDRETAEIAMQAALTGHFVLSTLHANDTVTTLTRLMEIGIDASLIQSAVSALLAQRLIRLLCPKCKQAYEPQPNLLRKLGIPGDRVRHFYKENGCDECHGTGYRGRTGIYELITFDGPLRSLLVGRPSLEVIRDAARKAGMRTLWQSALYKVVEGQTSLAEAERVVG